MPKSRHTYCDFFPGVHSCRTNNEVLNFRSWTMAIWFYHPLELRTITKKFMLRPIGVLQKTRLAKSFQETCTSEQVQQSRFFSLLLYLTENLNATYILTKFRLKFYWNIFFAEKFEPCCLYSSSAMYEKAIFNANQLNWSQF